MRPKGWKHSPEALDKIGLASKRNWQDPSFREKHLSAMHSGYRHSSETRAKLALASMGNHNALGYKHSPKAKMKISTALRGRPSPLRGRKRDSAIVEKIAAKLRGRPSPLRGIPKPIGHGAKVSKALMGHPGPHYSHTFEAKAKIALSALGNKRGLGRKDSPDVKAKRAESVARFFDCWPRPTTRLERAMYRLLKEAGFSFVEQKRFGTRIVDAYVPDYNLVFEADGEYWHQDLERENLRDQYLLSKGVLAIVHLSEKDLQCLV